MPLPEAFHPAVRRWFDRAYAAPTSEQLRSWERIRAGDDVLVSAPTGSGKTFCAFLAAIDELTRRPVTSDAPRGIDVVYVSPLKALSSDVQKNLVGPLEKIRESAAELGLEQPNISVALRTGDSTNRERAAILRDAPDILVTTPESLYLMLTAKRSRAQLESVRTVIVDELHALMRDKRGSHLALSLARLDAVAASRPQRIGLSATVHPIAEAARFLSGAGNRTTSVVDGGHGRSLDISIEVPSTDLGAVASNEQWTEIYNRIAKAIEEHRTTLVFVNTRRQAERVAHQLQERLGEDKVCAHHGSLSKERRLSIESRLKAGDMRAIVATASLELGIDVGSVDLVCQIGSPRAMTTFLQRIGRAGHGLGRTSRGMLLPTSRDDLAECAALVRGIRRGNLDRIEPPRAPLDVLAQQIVAECAARPWNLDELYELFKQATPYASLTRSSFDEIVAMLVEGPAPRLGRRGALLHLDGVNGVAKGRRAARLVALTNGGAIPELADYRVVLDPDETFLGTVNEDWAIESQAGDVFVLGSHSWRIRRVESRRGVLRVVDAAGAPPSIPFWLGEAPARTWEHSLEVSSLRAAIVEAIDAGRDAVAWVKDACSLSPAAAEQLVGYVAAQRDALGVIPTMNDVVFERFFDESGGMQLVVHAPFGGRVNRAFGLALRKRFCVGFDFELQAAATDDAVLLSLGAQHSFPLSDAFHFLRAHQVDESLQQAALRAPMFEVRWRWNATRSLAVLRREANRKVQPFLQRMRADDLLAAVFPAQVQCQENATGPIEVPDHPLVTQTIRDCLYEAMDTVRLKSLLEDMEHGRIRMHARDTTEPSPFSHEILSSKPYTFLDDAPLEERRARAISLRRTLPESQRDLGALDGDAIERVVRDAAPAPRDADELHDVLMGLLVVPLREAPDAMLGELVAAGRAHLLETPVGKLAIATENLPRAGHLYGDDDSDEHGEAVHAALRGYAEIAGPFVEASFAARIGVPGSSVAIAAARLEAEGFVLRGRFTPRAVAGGDNEICDRRLLARIHRLTLDRLRSEIEPVSARDLMRFLLERHHLTQNARAAGRAGLRDAIGMLQGFEIAASAWETDILPARVAGYRAEWLDELCLSGEVAWARLSPRQTAAYALASPSKATPIALTMRAELEWLLAAARGDAAPEAPTLEAAKATLSLLERRGALFFSDLVSRTKLPAIEVKDALWDLIGRGHATSDGFQPLRDLLAHGRSRVPAGRFALLERSEVEPLDADVLADRVAGQWLARYGVVFRDLVAREGSAVPWRDVARALRRREAKGLVRGGRFVSGFIGEQYALPEAVDALRRIRKSPRTGEIVRIAAVDPLNLVGIILPGSRVAAHTGTWISYRDGVVEGPLEEAS